MKNAEYGLRKMQSMFHDPLNTQSVFNEIVEWSSKKNTEQV